MLMRREREQGEKLIAVLGGGRVQGIGRGVARRRRGRRLRCRKFRQPTGVVSNELGVRDFENFRSDKVQYIQGEFLHAVGVDNRL